METMVIDKEIFEALKELALVMQKTRDIADNSIGWPGQAFLDDTDEGVLATDILVRLQKIFEERGWCP